MWTVSDSDAPGLAAEADTVERLQAKLRGLIPELLAENEAGDFAPQYWRATVSPPVGAIYIRAYYEL